MINFFLRFVVFALVDYVLGQVPDYETTPFPIAQTSFTCHGRPPGYYADVETGCTTYHVCDGNSQFTYICPKRTLFQQKSKICDHSYRVRCEDSPNYFTKRKNQHSDKDKEEQDDIFPFPTLKESQTTEEIIDGGQNQTIKIVPAKTTQSVTEDATDVATTLIPTTTEESSIQTTTELIENSTAESSTVTHEPPPSENDYASQSSKQFLRVRLKDLRALFYIPEFDNMIISKSETEFILPLEKNKLMRFKSRKENLDSFSQCPTHCNPKYFLVGTCHPCIMIK